MEGGLSSRRTWNRMQTPITKAIPLVVLLVNRLINFYILFDWRHFCRNRSVIKLKQTGLRQMEVSIRYHPVPACLSCMCPTGKRPLGRCPVSMYSERQFSVP